MTPHFEFVGHDEGYFERRGATKEEIGFVLATGEVSETYSERYIAKGVLTGGYERPKGFYPHKELQVVYSIEGRVRHRSNHCYSPFRILEGSAMRITYSADVDAAYIYLTDQRGSVDTVVVDAERLDLMLDFDFNERLVGVEVLDASKRLDLKHLRQHIDKLDGPAFRWSHFVGETRDLLEQESPIKETETHEKTWVEDVGLDTVKIRSDKTGEIRKITRQQLEELDITPSKVIHKLGILHTLYEMGRPPWPAKPRIFPLQRDLSELTPKQ